jgi:hypothetical protein
MNKFVDGQFDAFVIKEYLVTFAMQLRMLHQDLDTPWVSVCFPKPDTMNTSK